MGGRQSWALGRSLSLILLVVVALGLDLLSGRSTFHLPYKGVGSSELPHCLLQSVGYGSHMIPVSPGNNMWDMQAPGLSRPQDRS